MPRPVRTLSGSGNAQARGATPRLEPKWLEPKWLRRGLPLLLRTWMTRDRQDPRSETHAHNCETHLFTPLRSDISVAAVLPVPLPIGEIHRERTTDSECS